jgi:hypothetical protein
MNRQRSKAAIRLGTIPRKMQKRSPGRRGRLIQSLLGADDEQGSQEFRQKGCQEGGLPEKVWEIYRGNMVSCPHLAEFIGLAWPSAPVRALIINWRLKSERGRGQVCREDEGSLYFRKITQEEISEKIVCGGRARDRRPRPSPQPPPQPADGGPESRARSDFPAPNYPFKGLGEGA